MTQKCPTCGNEIGDDATSCPVCGEHLATAPAPVEEVECPSCMSLVPPGESCAVCGEKLTQAAPPVLATAAEIKSTKECPSCSVDVEMHAAECPVCGYVFEGVAPQAAPAAPKAEPKLCPSCGVEVETDMIECPICGYKLEYEGLPPMEAPAPQQKTATLGQASPARKPAPEKPTPASAAPAPKKKKAEKPAEKKPPVKAPLPVAEPVSEAQPAVEGSRCPACGKPITEEMEVCPSCFNRLKVIRLPAEAIQISGEIPEDAKIEAGPEDRVCLVCGALIEETEENCPICRIPYGTEIEEPPEEEHEWETVGITVKAERMMCPNCSSFVTDTEELDQEHTQQKWFFRAILAIFAGVFLTSASVWAHGVTTENLSRGMAPMPLDWVINVSGWVLVALGAIFWFKSWRDEREHALLCPSCGETVGKATVTCPECGKALKGAACANCGAELPPDAVACPDCGTTLETKEPEGPRCANCGGAMAEGSLECAECGSKAKGKAPPKLGRGSEQLYCQTCGAIPPKGAKECKNCGETLVPPEAEALCPTCGATVPMDAKECPECGQKFA
ncbi:MAG: zinc ribbon domain-containing protein [Euryarchaeota archaeon]|nr:zinc ribbon domain-containing protein [Euryarchaeota archaeon]